MVEPCLKSNLKKHCYNRLKNLTSYSPQIHSTQDLILSEHKLVLLLWKSN